MIDWRRILLGMTVVVMLVPLIQLSTRNYSEGTPDGNSGLPTRVALGFEEASNAPSTGMSLGTATGRDIRDDEPHSETHDGEVGEPMAHGVGSTTTSGNETETSGNVTTTIAAIVTTTASRRPTAGPTVNSGNLTGDVCPCTITGTATLKGSVELRGDLVVNGGILIARSGVVVNGNGFQIMFMNGGRADFQGSATSTWSGNGSNANLKRDLKFLNLRRIMFHGAGPSVLRYFSVHDSGTSQIGDYPLHWHLNGNSVRGTLVQGVVVVNGAHHAFVPHGSHGITFKDTIAKNTQGTAYWWDPAGTNPGNVDDSRDIVFDHVLADGVVPFGNEKHRVAGFRLAGQAGNVVRNSAAINISGGADCSGFKWPEKAGDNSVWTFENNVSHSTSCHGIFVWQNDSEPHVVKGFTGSGISHGAYRNIYRYDKVNVEYVEIHAIGWAMTDSHAGDVIALRHRFEGIVTFDSVTFDSFTIDNASNNGNTPAHFVINDTNLTCKDVVYASVVDGTTIVIDGAECP